jgi:hypothetical protein
MNMKRKSIYKTAGVLLFTLMAVGCNGFLDEVEPQGKEVSDAYMNVESNAEKVIIGLYELLSFTSGSGPDGVWIDNHYEFYLGSVASDDAEKGSSPTDYPDLQMVCTYQVVPTNTFVRNFYMNGFWGVSRSNYVLYNIQDAPFDATVKQRMEGEAHFFRAYWYFYLLRHYGGMPIFTEPVKAEDFGNVPRSSFTETMAFIIDELKLAIDMLPRKEEYLAKDLGRATKGSAQGFLARVMLYRLGTDPEVGSSETSWQAVYDLTGEIISSGSYRLAPNFATLFEEDTDGGYRIESLFEYGGKGGWGNSGKVLMDWMVQGVRGGSWFGWGFNQPTQNLVDAFDPTDPRLSCTIYGPYYNEGIIYGTLEPYNRAADMMSDYYNRKVAVAGMNALLNGTSKAIIIIRYADVLLMRAEAAYFLGREDEARSRVNEVRERARNSSLCKGYEMGNPSGFPMPTTPPNIPDITSSGEQLLKDIWNERRLELALENFRTYDLIRTGRLVETIGKVKDDDRANGKAAGLTDAKEYQIPGIRQNIINSSLKVSVPDATGKRLSSDNGERYIPVFPIPNTEISYWNIDPNPNN